MTPYGIVYREDPYLYERSIETATKKCGFLRFGKICKFSLPFVVFAVVLFTAAGLIFKDGVYFTCMIVQCVITVIYVRSTIKRAEVKNKAKFTLSKTPIQIVFYENCFVSTQPYSKMEFSYDEVAFCEENQGLLTIVINNNISVFSIPCSAMVKGSYNTVCSILRDKLKSRYIFKGV